MPSKPGSELRRLDLERVSRADGRDQIGEVDAALEQADAAPELHRIEPHQIPRQIEPRQPIRFEQALIREVVDRKDRRNVAKDRMRGVERAQINRREPRLPVVRVHDRRRTVAARRKLQRGAHQHAEPARAVCVVGAIDAVDRIAVEERRIVDENRTGVRAERRLIKPDLGAVAADRNRYAIDQLSGVDATIPRHDERDIPSEAPERLGQRTENIGQPAGFRERKRF
jgi:hypothetical protein